MLRSKNAITYFIRRKKFGSFGFNAFCIVTVNAVKVARGTKNRYIVHESESVNRNQTDV